MLNQINHIRSFISSDVFWDVSCEKVNCDSHNESLLYNVLLYCFVFVSHDLWYPQPPQKEKSSALSQFAFKWNSIVETIPTQTKESNSSLPLIQFDFITCFGWHTTVYHHLHINSENISHHSLLFTLWICPAPPFTVMLL